MVFGHDKNEGRDIISNNSDYYIQNIIPKSYSTLALGSVIGNGVQLQKVEKYLDKDERY